MRKRFSLILIQNNYKLRLIIQLICIPLQRMEGLEHESIKAGRILHQHMEIRELLLNG